MTNKDSILEWIGCGTGVVFTALQTKELFQVISLILTCVATLVTIAYTLYKWFKNASKDGKISPDEVNELAEIIDKGSKELKDKIESGCYQPEESENKSEGEKK